MICEKCRAQLPDGSIYCKHCGYLIVKDAPGVIIRPDSTCSPEPEKGTAVSPRQQRPAAQGKRAKKKKRALPVIVLLLVLAVIGGAAGYLLYTQAARDTEVAIDAIGTVTLKSGEAIGAAEELYAALPEGKRGMVRNYPALAEARRYYDEITQALAAAREAMSACTEVTETDQDGNPLVQTHNKTVIDEARAAYDNLAQYDLSEEAEDLLPVLERAEQGYINKYTSDLWVEAYGLEMAGSFQAALEKYLAIQESYAGYPMEANVINGIGGCYAGLGNEKYAQGSYAEAMELYQKGLGYDDHADCRTGAMNCTVRELEGQLSTKEFARILRELESARELYGSGGDYASFKEKVEQEREKHTPRNGRVFRNNLNWGYGSLTLKAGDRDAYIKLESADDPGKCAVFYVRKNQSHTIQVGDGDYILKYAVGDDWIDEEKLFGDSTAYSKADEVIDFETTYSGGYVYYSEMTITLYTTYGGNFSTSDLDPEDF